MSNENQNQSGDSSLHKVYESRYRTSKYFLADQLRCSEAVQDFRTVKSVLASAPQFNVRRAFRFAMEPIPVTTDQNYRR